MKLFYREKGKGEPLIILHGLWGASDNWLPIADLLSDDFRVIIPDIRNHGQSPHADEMDYVVMSDDIMELIKELGLSGMPCIVGHSMGGKIVMALLMRAPDMVRRAVIIDIAPVVYTAFDGGRHSLIIDFMRSFDLNAFRTRGELTEAIKQHFRSERSLQLFLKNIRKTGNGFEWKVNHAVLANHFDQISGCPEGLPYPEYKKEILFIKGEHSDLIPSRESLLLHFPQARLSEIKNCGHWIHSEQPEELVGMIRRFVRS